MPVSYDYDAESRILHCQVRGELVISEVVAYFRDAYQDERIQEDSIEMVNLDQVSEFAVRARDVQNIEPQLHDFFDRGRIVASIFIGSQPLQIGIANMLSGLLKSMLPDYPALVARGEDEAVAEIESIRSGKPQAAKTEQEES